MSQIPANLSSLKTEFPYSKIGSPISPENAAAHTGTLHKCAATFAYRDAWHILRADTV